MSKGLIGRKIGMTQFFSEDGVCIPVTVVEAEPNLVTDIRTVERDGYSAVQLGYENVTDKHMNRPALGQFKKKKLESRRHLREIRLNEKEAGEYDIGAFIEVDLFAPGMLVDATGITKGKGFQGVMKKYGMRGMRATHGTHEARRNPGSIGNRKSPGRVFKGKRLPGHMGAKRVTTQNLKVVEVDSDNNIILLKGAVPGSRGSLVLIRQAVKSAPSKE